MTLSQKILIGFITCTIILVTVSIFSYRNSEKFINTNQWVTHTHEVLHEIDLLLQATVDAETNARGFVITGNDNFIEPYNKARLSVAQHADRVKILTIDNPIQQKNMEILDGVLQKRITHLEGIIELRKKDFEKAREVVASMEGKNLQDEIRRLIDEGKSEEYQLLAERKKSSDDDAANFNRIFLILLLIIAVVLVGVYLLISNNLKALAKAQQESNDKNWILSGNFDLNEKIRGEQEPTELAQSIINQLCGFLNARLGAIYLVDNGELQLTASYALAAKAIETTYLKPGEGLVGQAAMEKKIIVFNDVPNDYVKISSALGNTAPKNVVVIPFLQSGEVRGVAELAFAGELPPLYLHFLNNISENIAIVISAAQSRIKLKELLEETQRQAEELEAQQEELRQAHEELVEKTQLLEKSEAYLKVQQEELQQTNEELEEKANLLEEQKEKLELAKTDIEHKARELEQTNKYKSEFLANMSHELRTPLNSVLILAQLLAENKRKVLGEKEVQFAKNIYSSGTDLLNLINEILDLSKVESGKMELDIEAFSFQEIKKDINSLFSEVASNKSVDFEIDLKQHSLPHRMVTDKQRLQQILRNLLSNAFKFTRKGGRVRLVVDKAKPGVIFSDRNLNNASDIISFSVSDTGIGIPQDKQSVIFEAFQQADGSTKRKYGGTGLGLSISRQLAVALGGEIQLQSVEGQGSNFTLYLPAQFDKSFIETFNGKVVMKKTNLQEQPKNILPKKASLSTDEVIDDRFTLQSNDKVILIMEDDRDFARILLEFVRNRRYKGILAYDGNTGLSYARLYKPDAIILDLQMPGLDGTQVLKQLKIDPELRHIHVQIISGYDRRKEGMELGAFDFIQKPISKEQLQNAFDKIESFVDKKLKKLLIVEDNRSQNNAIAELVGDEDVRCIQAYSGREALELLGKETFECLIVDLGLPDMTGFDLLEKIKTEQGLNVPVIVYTGRDLSKEESNHLSKLANTVVLKTVNSHERLLDETILFLHKVESDLPKEKQRIIRQLHKTDEVLKNKKVLVVDDDIRNIYSLTNILEGEGMECLTADNGKVAVDMLKEDGEIDIVLMDVMMPVMDGYEATKEIRKLNRFNKLPIIALTAKAMKGDREKCLSAGMSDYVAKPINIDQLLSLMRVWLYK